MMSGRWMMLRSWLLLAPLLAVMTFIIGWPLAKTVGVSFTDAKLIGGDVNWVGTDNFARVLSSGMFWNVVWTTVRFVLISVTAEFAIGLGAALLLDQKFIGRNLLRALLILPWALPTVVNATMWRLIYNPDFGAFNALLTQTGLIDSYRSWLGEPGSALLAVCLADVWKNFPLVTLIALAALQSVPRELHAAAVIDGAGPWSRFRAVVLPYLIGPLTVAIVLRTIEAFKVFDIIWVMTRGGPANSTKTVSMLVYEQAFSFQKAGIGASVALVMVLVSSLLIAGYVGLLRRQGEFR
ncbi:carbohydrate ABC transporter permease [Dongia rigui]|uniref:Sugar ABC transporter permease n=1 Tax=Dongia rigui TaxID=940149 RepID=A0ABU5E0W1_9PROT|nr:sugar ABC transporter permease [Dongia rigui]MDY0873242.1 sugar ABC transporter permease [Dongia rigui]